MTTAPTAKTKRPTQQEVAARERMRRLEVERKKKEAVSQGKPPYSGCPNGRPHHYILPPPNGPEVTGICKYCNKPRTYKVSSDEFGWGYESSEHDRSNPWE